MQRVVKQECYIIAVCVWIVGQNLHYFNVDKIDNPLLQQKFDFRVAAVFIAVFEQKFPPGVHMERGFCSKRFRFCYFFIVHKSSLYFIEYHQYFRCRQAVNLGVFGLYSLSCSIWAF